MKVSEVGDIKEVNHKVKNELSEVIVEERETKAMVVVA